MKLLCLQMSELFVVFELLVHPLTVTCRMLIVDANKILSAIASSHICK
jgi:hypothetical protein